MWKDGQIDTGEDEAHSRFSQFCKRAQKWGGSYNLQEQFDFPTVVESIRKIRTAISQPLT